jgi:hypothetical protein
MYLNLHCKGLTDGITLSATGTHLSWPLDITTCQNDKLLFIAPPVLGKGVFSTIKDYERYQLVVKKLQVLPIERIAQLDQNTMRAQAQVLKNKLRDLRALPKLRNTPPKQEGDHYIVANPGEAVITGMREGPEFTYMNLNNGDSWSYWHPNDDYEYIHCFKHPDEWFKTEHLLPGYYAEKERERISLEVTPTEQGDHIITIRDFRSSTYWNGVWNPSTYTMDLHMASNVKMLDDFREQYSRRPLDFIPTWNIMFDPHNDKVYDAENRVINTYIPSELMRTAYKKPGSLRNCPMTVKTFCHAFNCTQDSEEFEHLMNWFAVIYQKRIKTQTVWVVSGIDGTGKGVISNEIIGPTLGKEYVAHHDGAILEEQYNGWIENKLFVSLNEVDITNSAQSKKIKTKLKHWINEPTIPVRHMYRGTYEAKNYSNFMMASNEHAMVEITEGDRRYNIGNYQPEKLVYTKKDIAAIRAENKAWMEYIMTRKADVDYARTILKTEARQQLIDISRTSNEDIAQHILSGDIMELFHIKPDMNMLVEIHGMNTGFASHYESIIKREVIELVNMGRTPTDAEVRQHATLSKKHIAHTSKLTREELHTMFEYAVGNMPATPAKFTKFLRHKNIKTSPIKIDGHTQRGLYVTWIVTSTQLEELKAWLQPTAKLVSSTEKPSSSSKPKAKLKITGS